MMKTIAIGETNRGLMVETVEGVNDPWLYRTYVRGVDGFNIGANSLGGALRDFARFMAEFTQ